MSIEKFPVPMTEGLVQLKRLASNRIQSLGSAVILIFGDQGVGKTSLTKIIESTSLGMALSTPPLVYPDDQNIEANRFMYHLNRGELPLGLPSLTAFTRLSSGLASKNFGIGKEVIYVEVACDQKTQLDNLALRSRDRVRQFGVVYDLESIKASLQQNPPEFMSIEERVKSGVYADILVDTSINNRISPQEAENVLTAN